MRSAIRPAVAAKLAAYDPGGAYALPRWFATGLLYDAGQAPSASAARRRPGARCSRPTEARKLADCGVVMPDGRDDLFIAAWRLLGVDPARATTRTSRARRLIGRSRQSARAFPAPVERAGQRLGLSQRRPRRRRGAANALSREGGRRRHSLRSPKEGAPLSSTLSPFRARAPPGQAYALLDFLLRPEIAARNAEAAGLVDAKPPKTRKRSSGCARTAPPTPARRRWSTRNGSASHRQSRPRPLRDRARSGATGRFGRARPARETRAEIR